jgi:hypothetical protein
MNIVCSPFTNIASGGTTVVNISGTAPQVHGLTCTVSGSGDIVNAILVVSAGIEAHVTDVLVDLGSQYLKYSGASNQNPIQFLGGALVERVEVLNFNIPNSNAGEGNFTLSLDEPVIRITGTSGWAHTRVHHLHLRGFSASDTATPQVMFVGCVGSSYVFNDVGPFELHHLRFDGLDAGIDVATNTFVVVGNVGPDSVVKNCYFELGKMNSVIRVQGPNVYGVKVEDNVFEATDSAADVVGFITINASGSPSSPTPRHCRIARNKIYTKGSGTSTSFIQMIGDATQKGTHNQIIDNQVVMSNATSTTHTMIDYDELNYSMISGNVTYKGNAGNASFPAAMTSETGNVPLIASIGTLNVAN